MSAATCAALLVFSTGLAPAADKMLFGHLPAVAQLTNVIGTLPATTNLHLAIGLPLHNQAALASRLQQTYDPASPNYRHFLTPEQFTEMFGPTEADYAGVLGFARTNGLTVDGTYSTGWC